MKTYILMIIIITGTLSSELFGINEVVRNDNNIKIRSKGVCYLDPGITLEQAQIIAKYDAINEMLLEFSSYLHKNNELLTNHISKDEFKKYFCNSLNTFIYKEGKEDVDNYPAYLVYLSLDIEVTEFDKEIFRILTDNGRKKQLEVEWFRFEELIERFAELKETTNKLDPEFIDDLTTKLTASDWANKGYNTDDIGSKLDFYAISIDLDPLYESSYLCLAGNQIKVGRYGEAIDLLNKIVNLNPLSFAGAYCTRGEVYYYLKEYKNAIKELEKAVAIDPEYADGYCFLGAVYSKLFKNKLAMYNFNKAIEIDDMYYKAYFMRGDYYRQNGKYEQALNDFNKTLTLNSGHKESYINTGLIYYLTGNFDKSVEAYNKALYLDELNPALFYNRGIAYRKLGQKEKAADDYKSYLLYSVKDLETSKVDSLADIWFKDPRFKPMK